MSNLKIEKLLTMKATLERSILLEELKDDIPKLFVPKGVKEMLVRVVDYISADWAKHRMFVVNIRCLLEDSEHMETAEEGILVRARLEKIINYYDGVNQQ